jgi:hypothetical protein
MTNCGASTPLVASGSRQGGQHSFIAGGLAVHVICRECRRVYRVDSGVEVREWASRTCHAAPILPQPCCAAMRVRAHCKHWDNELNYC